jgi:hypothetical protein
MSPQRADERSIGYDDARFGRLGSPCVMFHDAVIRSNDSIMIYDRHLRFRGRENGLVIRDDILPCPGRQVRAGATRHAA